MSERRRRLAGFDQVRVADAMHAGVLSCPLDIAAASAGSRAARERGGAPGEA